MSEKAVMRGFANGGEAVGTLSDGKSVFVRGAVPGEEIEVGIFQDKKRYARGRLLKVLKESPERIASLCPYFPQCPGCSYLHVDYSVELEWKQRQLEYFFKDIPDVQFGAPVGCSSRFGWRNKLKLHVENGLCGYRADDNTTLLPITDCLLAKEPLRKAISSVCNSAESGSVTLRYTEQDKVAVVGKGKSARRILTEKLGDFGEFKVGADSFFQTNLEIAELLAKSVLDEVKTSGYKRMVELYGGVGVFSVICAENLPFLDCEGVEIDEQAVRMSRRNAAFHGVAGRCVFNAGDAGTLFRKIQARGNDYLLLVDPPRTGMDKNMTAGILQNLPGAVVYISCGADTMVRDIKLLSEQYSIKSIRLFDMFPGTAHFETLAILKRRQ